MNRKRSIGYTTLIVIILIILFSFFCPVALLAIPFLAVAIDKLLLSTVFPTNRETINHSKRLAQMALFAGIIAMIVLL
jgi:preprotein translocase subunit SecE